MQFCALRKNMNAVILNGNLLADQQIHSIKQLVDQRLLAGLLPPCLVVILVGNDPASCIYVEAKKNACVRVGFDTRLLKLPAEITESELLNVLHQLNNDPIVHGILIQRPLPVALQTQSVIEAILPHKDVDGFHPYNLGRLSQGSPLLRPCTPHGIMQLLEHYKIGVHGKHAVIIGASTLVGRPMALELLLANATITLCHRATKSLEQHVRSADLLIIATGTINVIQTSWLASHQVVIDVGIHRLENGSLCGDVDFQSAVKKVAYITPVPGGVGPMTVCTLLNNTLLAATGLLDYPSSS